MVNLPGVKMVPVSLHTQVLASHCCCACFQCCENFSSSKKEEVADTVLCWFVLCRLQQLHPCLWDPQGAATEDLVSLSLVDSSDRLYCTIILSHVIETCAQFLATWAPCAFYFEMFLGIWLDGWWEMCFDKRLLSQGCPLRDWVGAKADFTRLQAIYGSTSSVGCCQLSTCPALRHVTVQVKGFAPFGLAY